ncbi:MAG: alpha/beta hydrolase family esterase [Oligoflexus sp.]
MLHKTATLALAVMAGQWMAEDVYAQTVQVIGPNDRPARLLLPETEEPSSLILFLHGYGSNSADMDRYLGLSRQQDQFGFALLFPEGLVDSSSRQFWNATSFCCDFEQTQVDDSAYLRALIEEAVQKYNIDPQRIMVWGYSNGGFMAYRMACDHADLISGIVNLTGAMHLDPNQCRPTQPVDILHIHGTADEVVSYSAGKQTQPGAEASVAAWAQFNRCATTDWLEGARQVVNVNSFYHDALDWNSRDIRQTGETDVLQYRACEEDARVTLWKVNGAGHGLNLRSDWIKQSLQELGQLD